jgi:hypothetical protein
MAGKQFIEYLEQEGTIDKINLVYKDFYTELSENDTTQKQAISAALILTADKIITELFFDDKALTCNDIKGYLQTKKDVSSNERGYAYLCGWVSQNSNKFKDDSVDIFGRISGENVYFIANVFQKACEEGGFNDVALLSFLKERKLIRHSSGRNTIAYRINGMPTRCVCLVLVDDGELELPF